MDYQKRHFLSIKEVSNLIGISVSSINRQVEKGTFPPKQKIRFSRPNQPSHRNCTEAPSEEEGVSAPRFARDSSTPAGYTKASSEAAWPLPDPQMQ